MRRIVFTGGGTAGHITPNIALIQSLLNDYPDTEILYIGSRKGPENELIQKINIPFKSIPTGKLRRYFSWENFIDFFKVPIGTIKAYFILRKFKPKVIFSKGGYVSLPVIYAASWLKIPIILHESDLIPGLANKITSGRCDIICVSYEDTKKYFEHSNKMVLTGNPVRTEMINGDRENGYKITGFSCDKPIILIMGGSQGANHINEVIRSALPELLKNYQIIHVTGKGKNIDNQTYKNYIQFDYVYDELADLYSISDIVISRSGANSLAEIRANNLSAILIPIAGAASRGEQVYNALEFKKNNPETAIIKDVDLEPELLINAIGTITPKKQKTDGNFEKIKKDKATQKILELIAKYL